MFWAGPSQQASTPGPSPSSPPEPAFSPPAPAASTAKKTRTRTKWTPDDVALAAKLTIPVWKEHLNWTVPRVFRHVSKRIDGWPSSVIESVFEKQVLPTIDQEWTDRPGRHENKRKNKRTIA